MTSIKIFIPSEWSIQRKPESYLKTDGSNSFTGNLNANGHTIENLGDPIFDNDVVNKAWLEKYFLKFKDDGTVDVKNARLTNLQPPVHVNDAATLTRPEALFCSGKVFLVREKRLVFDKVYTSMPEIGVDLTFLQKVTVKVELWIRLDENRATSFSVDFCKNRGIIFSKYYNYDPVNLESSSEHCSFVEAFANTDKFAINVSANMTVLLSYYLNISSLKIG